METIRHRGLLLRPLEEHDIEDLTAAARESVATVGPWMPWCHEHYSIEDARSWLELCNQAHADKSSFNFAVFSDDGEELLGGGGLNQFNKVNRYCNLGYWVRQSRQRQGVAVRATEALAIFGFAELGLSRIEIVIAEGNEPSHGVARKVGAMFECVARNRLVLHGEPVAASVYSLVPDDPGMDLFLAAAAANPLGEPTTASESAR